MSTPSLLNSALATDPIFAAIRAHQTAWELAREASDDDMDALMVAEGDRLAELLKNDADHHCRMRSNFAMDRDVFRRRR